MSIFVLAHVILALTSFRMISLVPHHLPRLIGFMPANRVDMDEFSRDAAWIGTAGALREIRKAIDSGANRSGDQRVLPRTDPERSRGNRDGTDSTMRAATDTSAPRREDNDE